MSFSVQNTVCTSCYARFVGAAKGNVAGFQRYHCPKCAADFFYPLAGNMQGAYGIAAAILAVGFFPALGQGPAPAALDALAVAAVLFGLFMNFKLKKRLAAAQAKPAPSDSDGTPESGPAPAASPVPRSKKMIILAGAVVLLAAAGVLLRGKKTAKPAGAAGAAGVAKSTAAVEGVVEWIEIPGGSFQMGSDAGEAQEKPAHRAAVRSFEMAKTAVTVGQYRKCVAAGACSAPSFSDGRCMVYIGSALAAGNLDASFQGDDLPVVCVDWLQARAFSQWVGGRLPSEAEWEYAARGAGRDTAFPWGNEPATCKTAVMFEAGPGCSKMGTAPVCSKPEGNTPQGLCDMAGNVFQWVQDWFHPTYDGAPVDGAAWEEPPGAGRVFRGGSWTVGATALRSSARGRDDPHSRMAVLGLRPVREHRLETDTRESQEGKTRAVLVELRGVLTAYRQAHQGRLPADLAGVLAGLPQRPLTRVPPHHPPSAEVHLFANLQDTSTPDTGGWGLVGNSQDKDYGSLFINCTHTDSKGSSWDSY